jgi:hypothetical protein
VAAGLAAPAQLLTATTHGSPSRDRSQSVWASVAGNRTRMLFLLWLIAVILVIAGIFQLFKGQMLWGIVLIVVGFLVGPGGYSVFS